MDDDSRLQSNQKGGSGIEWTPADAALRAYYDKDFNPADSQCCSCYEETLELVQGCNHFLCNKCSVDWRDDCFRRRTDYTCPLCRLVIIKYVPREGEGEEEEEEEENFIVTVEYNGESFEYDRRVGLALVEGKFPNLRYAIAVLFTLAEIEYDMSKLEVLFRQFIMADEVHDIIYQLLIILFDRDDEICDNAVSWLCNHVKFDYHKTLGYWDDESVITRIMGYGMYGLARQLFQEGIAFINVNSGEEAHLYYPLYHRVDYDMVRFMADHDLDVNQVYKEIHPLDYLLIHKAPADILQLFIDKGADMNYLDGGEGLLFRVIDREYGGQNLMKDYISVLLSNGCNDIERMTDPETLEVVEKDVFECLKEGTFTREEWEAMKLRSGKVVKKE